MNEFIFLILILLAFAFVLRVDFIFYIVYVCIGIFAWARFVTPWLLRGVVVERSYSKRAFWGEVVSVQITVRNTHVVPVTWLALKESMSFELQIGEGLDRVITLFGREEREFNYTVKGKRRGYYKLGPLFLATSDLFGLGGEQSAVIPVDYLTVYPRITPLSKLGLPSRLPFGTIASQQRLFEDPARPSGIRSYRSGDSLRQINWKVSAHTRSLLVKTYQPAISLETAVLLNLRREDFQRQERFYYIEWAIEVAASLATHLIDQQQAVGLMTNGTDPLGHADIASLEFDETSGRLISSEPNGSASAIPPPIPPRSGRPHLMKILERLARIEASNAADFNRWAAEVCHHLSWGVTVLVVSPVGDEKTCQTLHQLVRMGLNPVLVVVQPTPYFGQVRQRARRLGFNAYLVAHRDDLVPWQENR